MIQLPFNVNILLRIFAILMLFSMTNCKLLELILWSLLTRFEPLKLEEHQ